MIAVSASILASRRRCHDQIPTFQVFLDRFVQFFGNGQTGYLKNVSDMLSEERIENGITITGEIISKPPHPVATFRYQQFLVGEIPIVLRNAAFLLHEPRARAHDPAPRLMVFGVSDPDIKIGISP